MASLYCRALDNMHVQLHSGPSYHFKIQFRWPWICTSPLIYSCCTTWEWGKQWFTFSTRIQISWTPFFPHSYIAIYVLISSFSGCTTKSKLGCHEFRGTGTDLKNIMHATQRRLPHAEPDNTLYTTGNITKCIWSSTSRTLPLQEVSCLYQTSIYV